jgi:hypothetical protein
MENPAQAPEDARRAGIDLDLLDENLALSVGDRIWKHDLYLNRALRLQEAGLIGELDMLSTRDIERIAVQHGVS